MSLLRTLMTAGLVVGLNGSLWAQGVQVTDPPLEHHFGKIPLGATYATQYFSVFNYTAAPVTLGRLHVSNAMVTCTALGCPVVSASDFTLADGSADGCSGKTLAPQEGCSSLVHFVPKAAGSRTALLEVPVTGAAPVSRTLSGTGVSHPSDCVMDWAERSFPTLLTQGTSTFVTGPFLVRCYQGGTLCVGADAALPTFAPASVYTYIGGQLKRQSSLAELAALATQLDGSKRCNQSD